jgi:copper(I)-binding protein
MDMGGDDNGIDMSEGDMVMQMAPQANVPVPKGQSLLFGPGSYHVMLIGLNEDLVEGQTFNVTLVFENAGALTVAVVIEQR